MIHWTDLVASLAICAGLIWIVVGALRMFAAGQAASPHPAEERRGCLTALGGIAFIVLAAWGLLT